MVDLLTHQPVDLDLFRGRLNLPLADVHVRVLPCDAGLEHIRVASSEYDLFVNMSHGDMFVPRARHNLLRVFFPIRAVPNAASNAHGITGERVGLTLLDGFYRPEKAGGRAFAWTSRHGRAVLPAPSEQRRFLERRHLHLVVHGWRPAGVRPAEVRLSVNGHVLGTRRLLPGSDWTAWRVALPRELAASERLEVTLDTTTFQPRDVGLGDDCRELGVAIAEIGVARAGRLGTPREAKGGAPDETGYAAMLLGRTLPAARSYDLLLANSRYTEQWINRRWGLRSDVLYPPVELDLPTGPKQRAILSVGRFFAGSHNKKHLPMIEAFKALCDTGLRGWEFHLVGGCDEAMPEHQAYLDHLRAESEGYAIIFHVNASFDILRTLYATARIFWHATGFGEDEQRDSEAFEHFGITTVEAMAAGCVPVVIGKGGQVEIVEPGRSGLLWTTLAELQSHTRTLIEDTGQWQRMSHAAQERSRGFGMDRFRAEVRAVVEQFGRDDARR